ncbi:MAG: hypothetical protein ACD_24C00507G0001, partial [uncultured bacterium]
MVSPFLLMSSRSSLSSDKVGSAAEAIDMPNKLTGKNWSWLANFKNIT